MPHSSFKNEINKRFGSLIVNERLPNQGTAVMWGCICDCGNEVRVRGTALRNETTNSCGCQRRLRSNRWKNNDKIFTDSYAANRINSKNRQVPFEITREEWIELMSGNCFYCKREPYTKKFANRRLRKILGDDFDEFMLLNGVDKVIPDLGYVKNNCVSCCKYCNRAKSDLSTDEFKSLITLLYNNFVINKIAS